MHPTMTTEELEYSLDAIRQIVENIDAWKKDYRYDNHTNEFIHASGGNGSMEDPLVDGFDLSAAQEVVAS